MTVIGYGTVQLIPSLEGFSAKVREQLRGIDPELSAAMGASGAKAGEESGRRYSESFVGNVGRNIASAVGNTLLYGSIAAIAGVGIKAGQAFFSGFTDAAVIQQGQAAFSTLLGSVTKGDAFYSQIQKFAAATPFNASDVEHFATMVLGAGVAAKNVLPELQDLGDGMAALGYNTAQSQSAMLGLAQMWSRGTVDLQDLRQLTDGGIPALAELAKAYHTTQSAVQGMISSGDLLASDALPKLLAQMEKDYAGGMVEQSATLAGSLSNLGDTIKNALGQAFLPLSKALAPIVVQLADQLPSAIKFLSPLLDGIAHNLKGFKLPSLDPAKWAHDIAAGLPDWAKALFGISTGPSSLPSLTPAKSPLSPVFSVPSSPHSSAQPAVDAVQKMPSVIGGLLGSLGKLGSAFTDAFGPSIAPFLNSVYPKLVTALTALGGLLGSPFLIKAAGEFGKVVGDAFRVVGDVIGSALPIITGLAIALTDMLAGKGGKAWHDFLKTMQDSSTTMRKLLKDLYGVDLVGFDQNVGKWVAHVVGKFIAFPAQVTGALGALAATGAKMFTNFLAAAVLSWYSVTSWLDGLPRTIIAALGDLGSLLVGSGAALMHGFASGINSAASAVYNAAKDALSTIARLFPHSPALEGPFSGKGWTEHSGRALADGFASGITSGAPAVYDAATRMMPADVLAGSKVAKVAGGGLPALVGASTTAASGPGITQNFTTINPVSQDPIKSIRTAAQIARAHMSLSFA